MTDQTQGTHTSEIIDAALAYAKDGLPILPLYGVAQSDGALEHRCTCSKSNCTGPGKHPRSDLAYHGVHDATMDLAIIRSWPANINIGGALGKVAEGRLAFDIDDEQVARSLRAQGSLLSDLAGVGITGRGLHLWFRSRHTAGFNVRDINGRKIGEVRGDGQYVVLPPSFSARGRPYRWYATAWDGSLPTMPDVSDPRLWVHDLLAEVGVNVDLAADDSSDPTDSPTDPIYPKDLPEAIAAARELTQYRQVTMGGGLVQRLPEKDRSRKLWALAMHMLDASRRVGYDVSREEIASYAKLYDSVAFAERKYGSRRDQGDQEYWRIATKTLRLRPSSNKEGTMTGTATAEEGAEEADAVPARTYFWDPKDDWLYYAQSRVTKRVCNFRPIILEDILLDDGDKSMASKTERLWLVRCTLADGTSEDILLATGDRASSLGVQTAISRLPAAFSIAERAASHIVPAMQALSAGLYQSTRVTTYAGWVKVADRWAYLLPGAAGAITADGIDHNLRIDATRLPQGSALTSVRMQRYGKGCMPPINDNERQDALRGLFTLLDVGPSRVTAPVVLQVLTGPLASFGATRSILHVLGKTGSFKTFFSLCAISLFGTFIDEGINPKDLVPETWRTTHTARTLLLHDTKDLTILIDDYKRSNVKDEALEVQFVNSYADGTVRSRATTDQRVRATKGMRGIVLSTGEDYISGDSSARARSLIVTVSPDPDKDLIFDKLRAAEDAVRSGSLQRMGAWFVSWLARQSSILDDDAYARRWESIHATLIKKQSRTAHFRLHSSLATLYATAATFCAFLREEAGTDAAERFKALALEGLSALSGDTMTQHALVIAELSPYQQFISGVREAVSSGRAKIQPRRPGYGEDQSIPQGSRAPTIGYTITAGTVLNGQTIMVDSVLLTERTTLRWLAEGDVRARANSVMEWEAVVREASQEHNGRHMRQVWVYPETGSKRTQMSGLVLPLTAVIDDTDDDTSTTTQGSQGGDW